VVETPEEAKAREERGEQAPTNVGADCEDDEPAIAALLEQLMIHSQTFAAN
jgi:hypothetical protein